MSDWLAAGAQAAGGLASGITGLVNIGFNRRAYWRQLEREDTAVQRRAKDMEAAGVNPLLAAGSPAQSTPQAQQKAPDLSGFGKGMEAMMNRVLLHKANTDITRTEADTRRVDAETKGIEKRNALIDAEFGLKGRGVDVQEAAQAVKEAELKLKQEYQPYQIDQINSSIARNRVLNTATRQQNLVAQANIKNIYSMIDHRDLQSLGQIIANEFSEMDLEKWGNTRFPRGGVQGWISQLVHSLDITGQELWQGLRTGNKPEGMSNFTFRTIQLLVGGKDKEMEAYIRSIDKKQGGASGSWDSPGSGVNVPQSGSDRAAPMNSGTGMR